ncbi:MAG: excinuclease ABC subunit UvrB [Candidatus Bathyarchaeota archaeon]|nr:excinuclease ABC subunit UvrB [Candidatus Bathyarchaeota archaeon]
MMSDFKLVAPFKPTADQSKAIKKLLEGLENRFKYQTLLGVTGSGKTFTMANVIEAYSHPTLVISHNKTLAAQLASEYKQFFPKNAVEFFVSDYDFYLPEAYLPSSDFYVAKRAQLNPEITRLRQSTTQSLMTRKDVIVVASVSCLFGAGNPEEYEALSVTMSIGDQLDRQKLLKNLVAMQYRRNDVKIEPGVFRVRGEIVDVYPAYGEQGLRIQFNGNIVERISVLDTTTGKRVAEESWITIFPAKFNVQRMERIQNAIGDIEAELDERVKWFRKKGKAVEAERLRRRTLNDLVLLRTSGYCPGIENYSMFLTRRQRGERPYTLFNYFPEDFLIVIDESHMTIPQIHGMYRGDRSRKENLVEYGFRLPSALENRPLIFEEFEEYANHVIFTSATPGPFEHEAGSQTVEQLLRPTGLLDPEIHVRHSEGQVDDLVRELRKTIEQGDRALVTTLTKRYSEKLADYLAESGIKAKYLHSEVETVERIQIIRELRQGGFDVLVGINLLREGLDIPEVALVAIFNADKEGFLRTEWALIQTMGRAARNVHGRVILYADEPSEAMKAAINETNRRRNHQMNYNIEHGITPRSITKAIRDIAQGIPKPRPIEDVLPETEHLEVEELANLIIDLEEEMREAASNLKFERAAGLRDEIADLRKRLEGEQT